MKSVGPPPNDLFLGCSVERRSVIIFFDFLLLLVFELGQDQSAFRTYPILTQPDNSRCHFDDQEGVQGSYASVTSGPIVILNEHTLVFLGTPLLRVIYRDSKSVRKKFLARDVLTDPSARYLFLCRLIW